MSACDHRLQTQSMRRGGGEKERQHEGQATNAERGSRKKEHKVRGREDKHQN